MLRDRSILVRFLALASIPDLSPISSRAPHELSSLPASTAYASASPQHANGTVAGLLTSPLLYPYFAAVGYSSCPIPFMLRLFWAERQQKDAPSEGLFQNLLRVLYFFNQPRFLTAFTTMDLFVYKQASAKFNMDSSTLFTGHPSLQTFLPDAEINLENADFSDLSLRLRGCGFGFLRSWG
jgi:hypothetical protein